MHAAGGSNIGLRKDNEDCYEIRTLYISADEPVQILVIADGMGGHEHGQLASRIAVEQFAALNDETVAEGFTLQHMQTLFEQANDRVFAHQQLLQDGIIGTTMTAAVIQENRLYLGHIGDSRCYIYRNHELLQISMDHTYYAELIRQGQTISEQDEKRKNLLMKALGPEQTVEGQYLEQELYEGDVLVLCTDGLYNSVSTEEATAVLEQIPTGMVSLQQAVEILLNKALEHGARDNLTLIIYLHGKNEI